MSWVPNQNFVATRLLSTIGSQVLQLRISYS